MSLILEILGWSGTIMIVYAYYGVSSGKLKSDQPFFQWLNFWGSVGIAFNVFAKKAWPAVALEVIWAAIALMTLFKISKSKKVLGLMVLLGGALLSFNAFANEELQADMASQREIEGCFIGGCDNTSCFGKEDLPFTQECTSANSDISTCYTSYGLCQRSNGKCQWVDNDNLHTCLLEVNPNMTEEVRCTYTKDSAQENMNCEDAMIKE